MSYASEVLSDSPVIFWQLDETSGTTAADDSGNGYDGTYVDSPTLDVTGLISAGTAVTFDGSSQLVYYDSPISAMFGSGLTVEAWIETTTLSSDAYIVGAADPLASHNWFVMRLVSGKVACYINTSGWTYTGSIAVNDGNAHHLAFTTDGSDLHLYIDGAEDGTGTASGAVPTYQSGISGIALACRAIAHAFYSSGFSGTIDEVAIYKTALSSTRIAAHYTAGTSSTTAVSKTVALPLSALQGVQAVQP